MAILLLQSRITHSTTRLEILGQIIQPPVHRLQLVVRHYTLTSLSDNMKIRFAHHRMRIQIILTSLIILAVGGVSFGVYSYVTRDVNPIPTTLRQNLTFSPLVIQSGTKGYTTSDYRVTKTENSMDILSYTIHTITGSTIRLSEYPQPQEFTDIPEYKDRFLTNVAQQYSTVATSGGTIYLGRLARQNNEQLGVMLEKGLIIFMKPDKDVTAEQWRALGDQLIIQKTNNN